MKSFALLFALVILASGAFGQSRSGQNVPAEIVGSWYIGSTSSLEYINRSTGTPNAAGGNGTGIVIKPDGTFTKAQLAKVGLYGCSTVVFGYQTGSVVADGDDSLIFDVKKYFVSYKDSCNPGTNSEKNAAPKKVNYTYQIKEDDGGRTMLCLNNGTEEDCFWREESE